MSYSALVYLVSLFKNCEYCVYAWLVSVVMSDVVSAHTFCINDLLCVEQFCLCVLMMWHDRANNGESECPAIDHPH